MPINFSPAGLGCSLERVSCLERAVAVLKRGSASDSKTEAFQKQRNNVSEMGCHLVRAEQMESSGGALLPCAEGWLDRGGQWR